MAEKATLKTLPSAGRTQVTVDVDFNPPSLRVNYRGYGRQSGIVPSQTPHAPGGDAGGASGQMTGYGETLSVELLFDTTENGGNVRNKTLQIARMLQEPDSTERPNVVFEWGVFSFEGHIDSLDETLEFFSEDGTPLRATVSLSMSRTEPTAISTDANAAAGAQGGAPGAFGVPTAGSSLPPIPGISGQAGVGTIPLTLAQAGDTLPGIAARAGVDWKAVARAHNIDKPLQIAGGTLLNLKAVGRLVRR